MKWDEQLIKACTETDGTPHPHTDHVLSGAKWQRDQLRTDEAVKRLANFLFEDDNGESIDQHEKICHDASKCRFRSDYTQFARAAIAALLEQEPRP